MAHWGTRIDGFKATADKTTSDAKAALLGELAVLETAAKQHLAKAESLAEDGWNDARAGIEDGWRKLSGSVEAVWAKISHAHPSAS